MLKYQFKAVIPYQLCYTSRVFVVPLILTKYLLSKVIDPLFTPTPVNNPTHNPIPIPTHTLTHTPTTTILNPTSMLYSHNYHLVD